VAFLLTRDGFTKKNPEKETEKIKACDNNVKYEEKDVLSTVFH